MIYDIRECFGIPENIEQKARDALSGCLQDIPFLRVESWDGSNADLNVAVMVDGVEQMLLVEAKNNGVPRSARLWRPHQRWHTLTLASSLKTMVCNECILVGYSCVTM